MVLPPQARAADELEALRQQMRVLADKTERLERERSATPVCRTLGRSTRERIVVA